MLAELCQPLSSTTFPDVQWVFRKGVKAVVFCGTLDLIFRVAVFGWSHYPLQEQYTSVQVWSSITSPEYNKQTLELFANNEGTLVIVATIAFGMGMNVLNIKYSINLGLPDSLEALVQQNGHAGRNPAMDAVGITYVPANILDSLGNEAKLLGCNSPVADSPIIQHKKLIQLKSTASDTSAKLDCNLHSLLCHVLNLCLESDKNRVLGKPDFDPALPCYQLG